MVVVSISYSVAWDNGLFCGPNCGKQESEPVPLGEFEVMESTSQQQTLPLGEFVTSTPQETASDVADGAKSHNSDNQGDAQPSKGQENTTSSVGEGTDDRMTCIIEANKKSAKARQVLMKA